MAAVAKSLFHPVVAVSRMNEAVAFYRDTLGLQLLFEVSGLAFFNIQGVRLMLSRPELDAATHSSILYYKTADIHATAADLEARGVIFEGENVHRVARACPWIDPTEEDPLPGSGAPDIAR